MSDNTDPPVAKYRYTIEITGNSHDEIERELLVMTRGGYLIDSQNYERDTFHVLGGTSTRRLEHLNPEQTPENYAAELERWFKARKADRVAKGGDRQ